MTPECTLWVVRNSPDKARPTGKEGHGQPGHKGVGGFCFYGRRAGLDGRNHADIDRFRPQGWDSPDRAVHLIRTLSVFQSINFDRLTTAFPRPCEIFGFPDPLEGPRFVGVVMGNGGFDGDDAFVQGFGKGVLEPPPGELGKERLDRVRP